MKESVLICPFCSGQLGSPQQLRVSETETALGGKCPICEAHFFIDQTGKNVGEMMEYGLRMTADELSRDPATLVSGTDYEDAILSYDVKLKKSRGPAKNFADGYGRLYVIKAIK